MDTTQHRKSRGRKRARLCTTCGVCAVTKAVRSQCVYTHVRAQSARRACASNARCACVSGCVGVWVCECVVCGWVGGWCVCGECVWVGVWVCGCGRRGFPFAPVPCSRRFLDSIREFVNAAVLQVFCQDCSCRLMRLSHIQEAFAHAPSNSGFAFVFCRVHWHGEPTSIPRISTLRLARSA